jgi:hypothetical protein
LKAAFLGGQASRLSHLTSQTALKQKTDMKTNRNTRTLLVLTLLILLPAHITSAQSYSIDWSTIDGGGGTSAGGVYSVSGTFGQPDAGPTMSGGNYSVDGGFWALPTAVQVTGAPLLTIAPVAPGQATISWTPNTPGYALQETWVLSPANWTNSLSGATNPITVPATLPTKFYRLFKP